MTQSYFKNYLQIYFWQGVALLLNFLSMFIVTPLISSNPVIFGIYSICISLTIFLSYADLGFISSGFKYASEYIPTDDRNGEIRIVGFVFYILLIFGILYCLAILFISFNPELIIKNFNTAAERNIAEQLLLILSLFSFNLILGRVLLIILGIRLDDFVYRRISSIANIINIASVYYFFNDGKHDIVGYYLFCSITNVIVNILVTVIIKNKYHYDFLLLMKSVRFSKEIFRKTRNLAFSTLFATFAWILYYELDTLGIAKLLGTEKLALYAICLIIINFFRSLLGTFFNPFIARFNHIIAEKNIEKLKNFFSQILIITNPLIIITITCIIFFLKYLILSWVGESYIDSVRIGQLLMLIYFFSAFSYLTNILLMAQERIKEMNIIAACNVIIFWSGVILTYNDWGLYSFAVFKLSAFIITGIYSIYLTKIFLGLGWLDVFNKFYGLLFVPVLFIISSHFIISEFLIIEKSKFMMIKVILLSGCVCSLSYLVCYICSKNFRSTIQSVLIPNIRR